MSQEKYSLPVDDARSTWASVAFMVESVVLLVFLAAALAVLTNVFATALASSVESGVQDEAVVAASSVAERFAADPVDLEPEIALGSLHVSSAVTQERRAGGTMYRAEIAVYDATGRGDGEPLYTLTTSCYRSEVS